MNPSWILNLNLVIRKKCLDQESTKLNRPWTIAGEENFKNPRRGFELTKGSTHANFKIITSKHLLFLHYANFDPKRKYMQKKRSMKPNLKRKSFFGLFLIFSLRIKIVQSLIKARILKTNQNDEKPFSAQHRCVFNLYRAANPILNYTKIRAFLTAVSLEKWLSYLCLNDMENFNVI